MSNIPSLLYLLQDMGIEKKPVFFNPERVACKENEITVDEVNTAIDDAIKIGFLAKTKAGKLKLTNIGQVWLDENTEYVLNPNFAKFLDLNRNPEKIEDLEEFKKLCKQYKKYV